MWDHSEKGISYSAMNIHVGFFRERLICGEGVNTHVNGMG